MKRKRKNGSRLGLWCMVGMLAACSSVAPVMNAPAINRSAEIEALPIKNDDDTLLVLTFSGGGTRAAALSYGVLKALDETVLNPQTQKTLLDDVDIISSVSGGSFTAAYYGLFGKAIFQHYEVDFLKQPVQSELLKMWLLSPDNWGKLGSNLFNRSDLAAEYYDKLFAGKTFADMRKDLPFIAINATDISTGALFSFTPENMHWICSDLSSYPVSRAVAASAAVPGVFSPIMLENYRGCAVENTWGDDKAVAKFQNKQGFPYLHLVDGGISDNLGVRSVLRMVRLQDNNLAKLLQRYQLNNVKHVAFIVVNAADDISPIIAQTAEEPSVSDTIGAVTTIQSKRYNRETLNLLNAQVAQWQAQEKSRPCAPSSDCTPIEFHVIELNFEQLPSALADDVALYETSLELPENQVDTLIYGGQYLLYHNANFLKFLHVLGAERATK